LTRGEEAVVIGQGNVALDVARMLLEDVDVLRKTDITDHALAEIARSKIKRVHVVGRRGPMQASQSLVSWPTSFLLIASRPHLPSRRFES
jgi:adrenodoxin-NADP+ reductase